MVSRSWTNLYSLNSSFSLTSLRSKPASIFLEGDWQPCLTPSPRGWTPNLSTSVLACKFLPITLPGSSKLEAANFTASGPFYPLCIPRVALQFSSKKAKLSICGKLVILRSAESGEGYHLTHCQNAVPLSLGFVIMQKSITKPNQHWWEQAGKMASGLLGPLESAALSSLTSVWSGFQPPTKLGRL